MCSFALRNMHSYGHEKISNLHLQSSMSRLVSILQLLGVSEISYNGQSIANGDIYKDAKLSDFKYRITNITTNTTDAKLNNS